MMIYKEFDDFGEACQFYKTVKKGKIEGSSDNGKEYWIVWYDAVWDAEEPKREEVIDCLNMTIIKDPDNRNFYNKFIEYIQQAPKYRKKAKRWKRKYMSLRSEVEKIRAEIAEDMTNVTKEAKQSQDDIDCGITVGLQMALDTVSKHMKKPLNIETQESDHKCHTCKHYTSGEHDGSCGSYICKGYSNWEREVEE